MGSLELFGHLKNPIQDGFSKGPALSLVVMTSYRSSYLQQKYWTHFNLSALQPPTHVGISKHIQYIHLSPVPTGKITNENVAERSRTSANRTRT